MTAAAPVTRLPRAAVARKTGTSLVKQATGVIGLLLTGGFVLVAVFGPWLVPHDPLLTNATDTLAAPSAAHLLGTDEVGRDVLSRIIGGTRPALTAGIAAVLIAAVGGAGLGVLAGYYGGTTDVVIMRLCDVLFAFPNILLGIFAVVVLGPGIFSVVLAVGIGSAPMFARLARAEVLDKLSRDYVTASRGLGGTDRHIVFRHVVPNIATTLVVQGAAAVSAAVVLAAALDFIGLGSQPPDPSWGAMLQTSRNFLAIAPLTAIAPGLVITVFVLGVNLLATGLANSLDPKIRTRILNASRPGLFARRSPVGGVR